MVLNISAPAPTKESGQRSLSPQDIYLTRYLYPFSRPTSVLSADAWRAWVFNQPIAMVCRETLIANFLALEWRITARDSKQQDELKPMIRYYTRLLESGGFNPNNFGMDYSGMVEWILADLLDLPFGSGTEVMRRNDSPGGRILWLKPLDGGTLYPTLNKSYPVVQFYSAADVVKFPAHAIARVYMSPRPELLREGWGLAPPEKVFLALEMLVRGDRYYANLLLDVPPAGILDLGDMEQASAQEWITAFKAEVMGSPINAFKIPVLYEHTTKTEFIPFGKPPTDIMYDRITMKYAEIVCAAYGLSLSDIGMSSTSNGGETLAGSIRQERKSRRTGIGRVKSKMKGFFESLLPDVLQFDYTDLDDELSVSLGRARLANSQSWKQMIESGIFTAGEARLQTIADGLITINIPEAVPAEAKKAAQQAAASKQPFGQNPNSRQLGKPVPASGGGQGEVRKSITFSRVKNFDSHLGRLVRDIVKVFSPIIAESAQGLSDDELFLLRSYVDDSLFGDEDVLGVGEIIAAAWKRKSIVNIETDSGLAASLKLAAEQEITAELQARQNDLYQEGEIESPDVPEEVIKTVEERLSRVNYDEKAAQLLAGIQENIKSFVGKSVVFIAKDMILAEDVFDAADKPSYDSIVNQVYKAMFDNFDEFFYGCVDLEIAKTLNQIKLEALDE